jgi:hypothetical protein
MRNDVQSSSCCHLPCLDLDLPKGARLGYRRYFGCGLAERNIRKMNGLPFSVTRPHPKNRERLAAILNEGTWVSVSIVGRSEFATIRPIGLRGLARAARVTQTFHAWD